MTLIAVETVSCVSLYGATVDCAQEDCGGPPYIPGNNRAQDAEATSNEADASDGARPSTDADASSDATTTSDADGSRDASGD